MASARRRFDQPFVLLLVEVDNVAARNPRAAWDPAQQPSSVWMNAIEALNVAVGETAVLGWFEECTVLGAIVPEMTCGSGLETVVRQELARRLNTQTVTRFSVRSHVYSPHSPRPQTWQAVQHFLVQQRSLYQRRPADYRIKRSLDFAGSLTLLLILSPVFLLIAALLKLTSPGPILFRQPRLGQMAKPFRMLKFRTMRVNADHALHHEFVTKFIRSSAQLHPAGRKALFKLTNDPRVTPLGRILRKTSLDELPQLWNVFRGDMSLVGPRPPLAYEMEQYRSWHWRRVLDAKPGMTGLWQVSGRSRTTFDEMVRLDLRYVRTCSLWTDIQILLATPRAVLSGKGAG
ncbi:MAG: sugar transferase [Acidobacteria bacterium]|nr:sugar transferase [Acidobacteriota bacterium]